MNGSVTFVKLIFQIAGGKINTNQSGVHKNSTNLY